MRGLAPATSMVTTTSPTAARHAAAALTIGAFTLLSRPLAADVAITPRGPVIDFAVPPAMGSAWSTVCSLRHALCVHFLPGVPTSLPLLAVGAAERAWDVFDGALALPLPDVDLDGAWHIYLSDAVPVDARALLDGRDPRAGYDRGTSFAVVDRATAPGCALDAAMARALARAAIWRAAPGTDEASANSLAEAIVSLAAPCTDERQNRSEFQSHPERTIADPSSYTFDLGASAYFEWLDATYARDVCGLLRGLLSLAPTRTPPSAWRWSATPTGYDVLRASLKGVLSTDSTLDDVIVRFALERARLTPSARLSWHIPWPEHGRRLASPEPVSPLGASYVLVDHAGAPAQAKLRLEAQWEDYGRMRWVVLKLDAHGRTTAEVSVTSLDRGTLASLTVESLEGVDSLLIVGVNVGSTEHPFDPDQGEWEPHGWLLTLEGE
jgi:hypothetical protein